MIKMNNEESAESPFTQRRRTDASERMPREESTGTIRQTQQTTDEDQTALQDVQKRV